MKNVKYIVSVLLCLFQFFSLPVFAQKETPSDGNESNVGLSNSSDPVWTEREKYAVSDPSVIVVNIHIGSRDYKDLVNSEEKKQYNVNVSVGQKDFETAKINIRGNSSRQLGLATPTKRIPFELSFPEPRHFGGIENKSVKFINSISPYRLLAEYLGLDLFSFAGIPTPAHSFAFVQFNDVDFGLYIAVEDVNKPFLRKWYPEPLFSAYKATINEEKRAEFIDTTWFGHLFEKVSGGADNLSALTDALDRGEGFEQYINTDEWLRFFACCAVMGGDGTMLTEQNNFVLYDNNGKFDLIPWDLSEAFSGRRAPDNIDRYYVWHSENHPNPLFDLLMSRQDWKEQYHAYVRAFTEGFLHPSAMRERYDAILDAVSPYLPRDHSILLNSEMTLSELRSESPDSYANLRHMLNACYENLTAQLEGRVDAFAVNEFLRAYYEQGDSYEWITSELGAKSPLLDPELPEKIISQGKQTHPQAQSDHALRIVLIAAFFVALCAAGLIAVMRKNRAEGTALSVRFLRQGVKDSCGRHRVMFAFLLFIILYECIFVWQFRSWGIGSYPYVYHVLDYSLGFCTRVLPGAVSNLLLGEVTELKVTVFETVLLLLFFVCLSWFLEKMYYRFTENDRPQALLLFFLFVTGPCTFEIYVKELGMLDAWLLYSVVVIFFLFLNKKLWPLIVVFAFVLTLIYTASILCMAPFVVIILLYKATVETNLKDRRRLFIIAGAFAVVAIGFTVYFLNFEPDNVKLMPEEFFSLIHSRGCEDDNEVYNIFFGVAPEGYGVSQGEEAFFLYQIIGRIKIHLSMLFESSKTKLIEVLCAFLLVSPVLLLLHSFIWYKMKNSQKLIQKFTFFCMLMLFFFINIICFFVSTDTNKWLAQGFMLTFACCLVVLYHEPQLFSERIKPLLQKIPLPVWVCYCLIYAAMVFAPYS